MQEEDSGIQDSSQVVVYNPNQLSSQMQRIRRSFFIFVRIIKICSTIPLTICSNIPISHPACDCFVFQFYPFFILKRFDDN